MRRMRRKRRRRKQQQQQQKQQWRRGINVLNPCTEDEKKRSMKLILLCMQNEPFLHSTKQHEEKRFVNTNQTCDE